MRPSTVAKAVLRVLADWRSRQVAAAAWCVMCRERPKEPSSWFCSEECAEEYESRTSW